MNNQFFCVHGGLSPHLSITDPVGDINAIDRFVEPPSSGLMCDLLWADPEEDYSVNQPTTFKHNGPRGTSHIYGYAVLQTKRTNRPFFGVKNKKLILLIDTKLLLIY